MPTFSLVQTDKAPSILLVYSIFHNRIDVFLYVFILMSGYILLSCSVSVDVIVFIKLHVFKFYILIVSWTCSISIDSHTVLLYSTATMNKRPKTMPTIAISIFCCKERYQINIRLGNRFIHFSNFFYYKIKTYRGELLSMVIFVFPMTSNK